MVKIPELTPLETLQYFLEVLRGEKNVRDLVSGELRSPTDVEKLEIAMWMVGRALPRVRE